MIKTGRLLALASALAVGLPAAAYADGFQSYKVCGGLNFSTCAAVSINVVGSNVTVRVWNLSGNGAATYGVGSTVAANTVFNGIGFYNTGGVSAVSGTLQTTGPVRAGDTPSGWGLQNNATLGFSVDWKTISPGTGGANGIASGCAAIPTNIEVNDSTRGSFGAFYAALFDRTIEKNPKAIVTEYAWQAGSCDPCPTPPLDVDTLAALGADVIPSTKSKEDPSALAMSFVLTRLHARYTKETLGADLVFRDAEPIVGGRETFLSPAPNENPHDRRQLRLERTARADGINNFQARYIIRHPWTGPIECASPERGIWEARRRADAELSRDPRPLRTWRS